MGVYTRYFGRALEWYSSLQWSPPVITLLQDINGKNIGSRTDIYFQIYQHLLGGIKKDTITTDSVFFLRIWFCHTCPEPGKLLILLIFLRVLYQR